MLVVLTIMLLLAALAIAFVPSIGEQEKTARAADRVQGWLVVARQWARRDGVPTGIRLLPGQSLPNPINPDSRFVTDLQYIQQPDPLYIPNTGVVQPNPKAQPQLVAIRPYADLTNGDTNQQNPASWLAQPGDYLEVPVGGTVHRILQVIPPTGNTSTRLLLASVPINPTPGNIPLSNPNGGYPYRIIRAPRVVQGEPALQLPQGAAIDLTTNATYQSYPLQSNADGSVDIVFTPSGSLLTKGTIATVVLWIRDATVDDPNASGSSQRGQQTLIAIYGRTGQVAAHPVDVTPSGKQNPYYANPYSFIQDGRSSGL
jgi:hypothetical protein